MAASESFSHRFAPIVLIFIGFLCGAFSAFSKIELWLIGVEETAVVTRLHHTSWAKSTGKGFHYDIESTGRVFRFSATGPVQLGSKVQILVDPNDSRNYEVGSRQSGFLRFFLGSFPGEPIWQLILKLFGFLTLVLAPLVLLVHGWVQRNRSGV